MLKNNEIAVIAVDRSIAIKRKRKKHKRIRRMSVISGMLFVAFTFGVTYFSGTLPGEPGEPYAAQANTTLFGDSAVGGYVLIGIASFFMGVIVTVICKNWMRRRQ